MGSIYGELSSISGLPIKKDQNPIEATLGARIRITERLILFGGYSLEGFQDARSHENRFNIDLKLAFNKANKKILKRIKRKKRKHYTIACCTYN